MDQDETIGSPPPLTSPAGPPVGDGNVGPILETLSARITVRFPYEHTAADEDLAKSIDLTNNAIGSVVKAAVENHIDLHSDAIAQAGFTVSVRVEKV